MKIRDGFVSNSSSCSFTCPKCHHVSSGWDWEDAPICSVCGTDPNTYPTEDFAKFLCKKHDLDYEYEHIDFLRCGGVIEDED